MPEPKQNQGVPPAADAPGPDDVVIPVPDPGDAVPVDVDDGSDDEPLPAKLDNAAFAEMRKKLSEQKRAQAEAEKRAAEAEKRAADAEKRAGQPAPQPRPITTPAYGRPTWNGVAIPQTAAEWDRLVAEDWQLAVDMKTHLSTQKQLQEAQRIGEHKTVLESAKAAVLKKHPELADSSSEKTRIFLSVLQNNPEYETMAKGPIFAMRDMEEILESAGAPVSAAPSSADRAARASLTASRSPATTGKTVTLTKEELEFCKDHGINPKDFAKQRVDLEARQKGAEV